MSDNPFFRSSGKRSKGDAGKDMLKLASIGTNVLMGTAMIGAVSGVIKKIWE